MHCREKYGYQCSLPLLVAGDHWRPEGPTRALFEFLALLEKFGNLLYVTNWSYRVRSIPSSLTFVSARSFPDIDMASNVFVWGLQIVASTTGASLPCVCSMNHRPDLSPSNLFWLITGVYWGGVPPPVRPKTWIAALTWYTSMVGAVSYVNYEDGACSTYYTGNFLFSHVYGEPLFQLTVKVLDGLAYFGLYNSSLRMELILCWQFQR